MLKPLLNNVLLIQNNNNQNQLIYLPNTTNKYLVISVGDNVLTVKQNDLVIVNENKLIKLEHNNQTYYIASIEDILLIVEDNHE